MIIKQTYTIGVQKYFSIKFSETTNNTTNINDTITYFSNKVFDEYGNGTVEKYK